MKTLQNVFFKHLFCPRCEKFNYPTKKEKGITLHAIQLLKTDDTSAYLNVTCMHCEAEPQKNNPGVSTVLAFRPVVMPIKSWEALTLINPREDGFVDR